MNEKLKQLEEQILEAIKSASKEELEKAMKMIEDLSGKTKEELLALVAKE